MHIILVVIFLTVGILIYFQQGSSVKSTLSEQSFQQEEIVVKAGNVLLSAFIDNLKNQISAYAAKSEIVSSNPKDIQNDLGILLDGWKNGPVSDVVLTDANGLVKFGLDRQGNSVTGTDLSDSEYFKWAKTASESASFVGNPALSKIGFTKGKYIVPVASPVIKNGKFNGVLVASFFLDEATANFLNPLKVSDKTLIYLVDENGVILSSSLQSLVGSNYLNYINGVPGVRKTTQVFSDTLFNGTGGRFNTDLPGGSKTTSPVQQYLVVYSPVSFGSSSWVFSVATPTNDTLLSVIPFYRDQLMSLIYLIVVILTFSIIGVTSYRIGSRAKNE